MTADARPFDFPVLILAAGASARMRGRDKLMEVVEGAPLLRRQIDMASVATTARVFVTLPPAPHPRWDLLRGRKATGIEVPDAAKGMSASLRRGLRALPADAAAVMVLLADLPELTTADLCRVAAQVSLGNDRLIWRGATSDGAPGHPIIFARQLFAALEGLHGDTGGAEVVAENRDRMVLVPLPGQRARRDLDTPEDWDRWRSNRAQ